MTDHPERDKVEEISLHIYTMFSGLDTYASSRDATRMRATIVSAWDKFMTPLLSSSEKRAEEAEARSTMLLGFTEEAQDKWQRVLDDRENLLNAICHLQSERDEARSSLARVVEALRQNIGTLEWTVDRCVHWGKPHGELDTAIEQSRSALHRSQGE